MSESAHHSACENCQTVLLGPHCHTCGQAAHNPLKHLGHAIEEVFESFWHLDGRVFRSLRDTCVPGRIIRQYLAGHRVCYLPPLRLFVIVSLFTFFLAQMSFRLDPPIRINADPISNASSLPALAAGQGSNGHVRIQAQADTREGQLQTAATHDKAASDPLRDLHINGRPWHPDENPLHLQGSSPGFNHWFNHTLMPRLYRNLRLVLDNPQHLVDTWISAIPSTLFFLVPVFALLLHLAHPRSGMSYLEHMVVALYSHSFILMGVSLLILLGLATHASAWPVLSGLVAVANSFSLFALAIWLLICQQRVYRQSWPLTLIKFGLVGSVYALLVLGGALFSLVLVFLR